MVQCVAEDAGPAGDGAEQAEEQGPAAHQRPPVKRETGSGALVLFGVLLPTVTIAVELNSGMCARDYFDPIPTHWHLALLCLVPLSNGLIAFSNVEAKARHWRWLGILNGVAMAVALAYSLVFLPLMGLAIFALVMMGLGLLPMTPLISLVATMSARKHLRLPDAQGVRQAAPGLGLGLLLGVLGLSGAEAPWLVTDILLRQVENASSDERAGAIASLRTFGSETELLRRCYSRPNPSFDFIGLGLRVADTVSPLTVREIFYRVTGQPFDALEPPDERMRWAWSRNVNWRLADWSQGGNDVGARVAGLSLVSSVYDGVIEPDAAQAYMEWTAVFENSWIREREARMVLRLPPGGVVSRVTLWVDGEEREAAFAGRTEARAAYQRVVARRLDPLLVSTDGIDSVLVQCFPVPPDNGRMRIRIGVTAPLLLGQRDVASLRLPLLVERNFAIPDDLLHSLWLESTGPVQGLGLISTGDESAGVARGDVSQQDLIDESALVTAQRDPEAQAVWSQLSADEVVLARVVQSSGKGQPRYSRLVVVVDGSVSAAGGFAPLADALAQLDPAMEVAVVVAGDAVEQLGDWAPATEDNVEHWADDLDDWTAQGGCDNVPALEQAWELCADTEGAGAEREGGDVIVWLHGSQPTDLSPVDGLLQRFRRDRNAPSLLSMALTMGGQPVASALAAAGAADPVPRLGTVASDASRLFAGLAGTIEMFDVERSLLPRASLPSDAQPASDHLARLWAHEEVQRLVRTGLGEANRAAQTLAVAHQLVTPVSGAVVLESAEQFQDAGLQPVEKSTVPTVPEPEMVVLMGIVGVMLASCWWRARKQRLALGAAA